MPVSPKDQFVEKGLSRDGETASDGGRGIEVDQEVDEGSWQEDEEGEMEGEGEEVRVPLGK